MLNLPAARIGDSPDVYVGRTVEFPDFHGRTVTGILQDASNPRTAAYATLRVGDRTRTVFKATPVTVL